MRRLECPTCLCKLKLAEDCIYDRADGTSTFTLTYQCLICGWQFVGMGRDRSQAMRRLKAAIKKVRDLKQSVPKADDDSTRRLH